MCSQAAPEAQATRQPLTQVVEITRLSPSEADRSLPVRIEGVVTYYDPAKSHFFVQDDTAGIYLDAGREDRGLRPGDLVRVEGITRRGRQNPDIVEPVVTVLGRSRFPQGRVLAQEEVLNPAHDSQLVTVPAVLRSVGEEHGRLIYHLGIGRERIKAVIYSLARHVDAHEIGLTLRVTGVHAGLFQADEKVGVLLLVRDLSAITAETGKTPSLFDLPICTVQELEAEQPGTPVHVQLQVENSSLGYFLLGHDSTGKLIARATQQSPVKRGTIIDMVGYTARNEGTLYLEDAYFRRIGISNLVTFGAKEIVNGLPQVESAAAVRRLDHREAEKGYPVRLRGVITYYDPEWKITFIQGAGDGVFIKTAEQPLDISTGLMVGVSGFTAPGDFAPVVSRPKFDIEGPAPMPQPKVVSFAQMLSGGEDSQWVQFECIIRAITNSGPVIQLEIVPANSTEAPMLVHMPSQGLLSIPEGLLDATVTIQAVCATEFDETRRIKGLQFFCPSFRYIFVKHSAERNPFLLPLVSVADAFRFRPNVMDNHRVHLRGTVTYAGRGSFYLQDSSGAIRVEAEAPGIAVNQSVNVAGFPLSHGKTLRLQRAVYRLAEQTNETSVKTVSAEEALLAANTLNGTLVHASGRLLDSRRVPDGFDLLLQAGETAFSAHLPSTSASEPDWLLAGSELMLTGVATFNLNDLNQSRGMRVLLRTPEDIQVLHVPPLWNLRKMAVALACLAGAVVVVLLWVWTLRRRVRAQTRVIEQNLAAQEALHERFFSFTRNIPGIAFIKTVDGKYAYVNEEFLRILGRAESEVLGKTDRELLPDAIAAEFEKADQTVLTTSLTSQHEENFSTDRKKLWLTTRFILSTAQGQPQYLCGIALEITEHKNLEAQLLQAQKMESIGSLAGGVAHDFNNILSVILGYTYLLKDPALTDDTREAVVGIEDAANRAAELTKQLLVFSRKQTLQPKPLNLNKTVQGFAKMLHRILGEDIVLQIKSCKDLPQVTADKGMIEQIIMNLAVNARDAMPAGGTLLIETSISTGAAVEPGAETANRDGLYACLAITDTGCGIPAEHLSRIFDPFFTTKEVGKGTGLGLATVYGIVKQHKGVLTVQSTPGQGTRFLIALPATEEREVAAAVRLSPSLNRLGGGRVLVVEDEGSLRDLACKTLQGAGYNALNANSGRSALALADKLDGELDLLITDMVMPEGLNGVELASIMKTRFPKLSVIFTSGYTNHPGQTTLPDGVIFMPKPYCPDTLLETIQVALHAPRA